MAYANQNTSDYSKRARQQANQQSDRQEVPSLKPDDVKKRAANDEDAPEKEAPLITPAPDPAPQEKGRLRTALG